VVTGASRGIGRSIAQLFADNGASVMLTSRKEPDLVAACKAIGGDVGYVGANTGRPDELATVVAQTMDRWGRIDILVNNASTCPYIGPIMDVDMALWDKTFDVNLRGPMFLIQQAWRASMAERGGAVLNLVSIGGLRSNGVMGVYDNSKAALIQLTKHLATELGPKVRVNAIAPGLVDTDMARRLVESRGQEIASRTPMRRVGLPQDIAPAALFLVSDAASWISGEVMVVDGGRLAAGAA
jgi:NAD(P)-dependent dehydrogenase (short-subunit alcohol dehydrogenase family)